MVHPEGGEKTRNKQCKPETTRVQHTHKVRKERSQSAEVMSEGRMEERERKCSSAFISTLRLQRSKNLDKFSEKMKLHPAHSCRCFAH